VWRSFWIDYDLGLAPIQIIIVNVSGLSKKRIFILHIFL
jgi:hypothetical protein